jgi:SAM-dependent methyltransferase
MTTLAGPVPYAYPNVRFRRMWRVRHAIESLLTELRAGGDALHLGCGNGPIAGVINCDLYSPHADRRVDATDLSDFADGTIHMIEHHHMIEHLSAEELERALHEWARVLKPGGFLVISAPDLERVIEAWRSMPEAGKWGYGIKMLYGSQEHAGMFHKNGFTPQRLDALLARFGLRQEWCYRGYPERPTPSFISIARKLY